MRTTLLECKIDPSTVLYASGSSSATRKSQQVTSLRFLYPAIFPSFFNRMHTEQVKKPPEIPIYLDVNSNKQTLRPTLHIQ
jgi:hypothetical protein